MADEKLGQVKLTFGDTMIYHSKSNNEMDYTHETFAEYDPQPLKSIRTLILEGYFKVPKLSDAQIQSFTTFFSKAFIHMEDIGHLVVERSFPDELWKLFTAYFLNGPINDLTVDGTDLANLSAIKTLRSYTHNVRAVDAPQQMLDEDIAPHMIALLLANFDTLEHIKLGVCTDAMHELIMSVMGRSDKFKLEVKVDLVNESLNEVLVDMAGTSIQVRLDSPLSHASLTSIPSKFETVTIRFLNENAVAFIEPFFLQHKALREVVFEMLDISWTPDTDPFNILVIPFLQYSTATRSLEKLTLPTKNTLSDKKSIEELVALVATLKFHAYNLTSLKIRFMVIGISPQTYAEEICSGGSWSYKRGCLECKFKKVVPNHAMTQREFAENNPEYAPITNFFVAMDGVTVK